MDNLPFFLAMACCLFGCLGFSMSNNVRRRTLLWANIGGCVALAVYLLTPVSLGVAMRSFFGTLAAALYSEIMARLRKAPVTIFLITGLFSLVPGAGIYYSMKYAVSGEPDLFLEKLLETLGVAGAMALGVILVSSITRLITGLVRQRCPVPPLKAPGEVSGVIDRPAGANTCCETGASSWNMGYISLPDGSRQRLLVMGIRTPLSVFTGRKAATIEPMNGQETIVAAVPFGLTTSEEEIRLALHDLYPEETFRIRMSLHAPSISVCEPFLKGSL